MSEQSRPAAGWKAITKSDTVDFARGPCRAIWVGGAGVVVAVSTSGDVESFTCVAGSLLPVQARRVNDTNTTATLLVALY